MDNISHLARSKIFGILQFLVLGSALVIYDDIENKCNLTIFVNVPTVKFSIRKIISSFSKYVWGRGELEMTVVTLALEALAEETTQQTPTELALCRTAVVMHNKCVWHLDLAGILTIDPCRPARIHLPRAVAGTRRRYCWSEHGCRLQRVNSTYYH